MIFDRHANLKDRYGNRKFWCRGYYNDIKHSFSKKGYPYDHAAMESFYATLKRKKSM